ncbi:MULTISPECIES: hypothetical protein [Streptomyces]|uniref:hypothetical protein n=1 Tax=Streptomyces TaxID=1883 RepID=UPI0001D06313|nr:MULTISPECIES: hypothetical protein [Streptomyces]MYS39706.1 hypothetical protein [Streptomyces sp. SID5998]MYX45305.1 hypothetical protein [Streptomyces sp. SID89]NED77156.1 hypothetical protein [Streptomyces sp. SID9944]EFF91093.1 hypothetical protein SSTG_01411 [Streptomyces sp. e14]MBY8867379.1 hypothetical protein [Streptomyces sennicomposti]
MLITKKLAATAAAGILGGFALFGFGAGQAFAHEDVSNDGGVSGRCVDDGNNAIRCVQSQHCSGGGHVDCSSTIIIKRKSS